MRRWIVCFMLAVIVFAATLRIIEMNSDVSRNTASFEKNLSENQRTEGSFISMIDFEFDQMIVFDETMSKSEMIQILEFEDHRINESEQGMHNIVFIKEKKIVAYLYGYHSFYLDIPIGIYHNHELTDSAYQQNQHYYTID